jgi:hypothetical protein
MPPLRAISSWAAAGGARGGARKRDGSQPMIAQPLLCACTSGLGTWSMLRRAGWRSGRGGSRILVGRRLIDIPGLFHLGRTRGGNVPRRRGCDGGRPGRESAIAGSSIAAMSRSVEPQRGQRSASISKTRWSSAAHRSRLGVESTGRSSRGGLRSGSRGARSDAARGPFAGVASAPSAVGRHSSSPTSPAGTTRLRRLAHGARIPWYRTWWARGGGIKGTRRSISSLCSIKTCVVPSRQRDWRRCRSRPSGRSSRRSLARGGRAP